MTIIAWDGTTLAADKQVTNCYNAKTVTKIFRIPQGLVGFAGNGYHAQALLRWLTLGAIAEGWPEKMGEDSADMLFITNDREICFYSGDNGPYYTVYEDKFVAMGSGRDYALAAMHLGHDAVTAVEVAIALDTCCGMGVDTLQLEA